jgi:hypothetical protein
MVSPAALTGLASASNPASVAERTQKRGWKLVATRGAGGIPAIPGAPPIAGHLDFIALPESIAGSDFPETAHSGARRLPGRYIGRAIPLQR